MYICIFSTFQNIARKRIQFSPNLSFRKELNMKHGRKSRKVQPNPEPDQPKDEAGKPSKKMKLESVIVAKHDIHDDELESLIECPVCL